MVISFNCSPLFFNHMEKFIFFIVIIFLPFLLRVQGIEVRPDRAYFPGGQIGMLSNLDAIYVNFGGPGVRLK
jgi:hypothetical protein